MSISKFAVKKPASILIIFVLFTVLGIYCTFSLPLDLFPDMDIPYMVVATSYANAGPEEVEKSVTRTMESSLSSVTGLKNIQSVSQAGMSMIILELEYGTNLDSAANDIRDKIDLIRNYLPENAGTPTTIKMDPSMMPIMALVVTGSRTPEELSSYAEDIIQPRLEQVDGVASANISGDKKKAIMVDIPRDRLDAYELTISQVAQMIGAQNITSSGGTITSNNINYSISAEGTYKSIEDIKQTVVTYKTKVNGMKVELVPVLLRDIANVYSGYKDESTLAYLDGKPSVMLTIQKQSSKNSVTTASKIRKQLKVIEKELPVDVQIVESYNTTDVINETVKQVVQSLMEGIILAVIVLYIFLRSFKSTFIIALSIPISVLVTLCLMYFCGFTINLMTLSGLLLGIGMLVDNSIVILENIFAYREKDSKPEVAAVLGSEEMLGSITASTLTTLCIFLPLILFQKKLGMIGKLFNSFAFTIVFSLLCSLFVAAVLVPVLCSKYIKLDKPSERHIPKIMKKSDSAVEKFMVLMDEKYAKGVNAILKRKGLVLGIIAAAFILSIASIKLIGFTFMPATAEETVSVSITLPKGSTLESTKEVAQQLERNIVSEIKGIKYSTMSIGGSSLLASAADTNTASITLSMYSEKERENGWDSADSAKEKVLKYADSFPGAEISLGSNSMASFASSTIDLIVKSDNLTAARSTAREIESLVKENAADYISGVSIDLEDGIPELKINMDRKRMIELGVTTYGAGSELNASVNGKTASRYDDDGTQIDIVVRLDPEDKKAFSDLEQLYVSNSMGKRIPFASFSTYEETLAPVAIRRENQTRTIRISVTPKQGLSLATVQPVIEKIVKENVVQEEGVLITYAGAMEEMIETVKNFSVIILMAMALVFAVMASQFQSFKDPFIILFTIPLSFIGVMIIYLITGNMLNIVSVVGMLVLVGTIVNNGIVLVDYTNLLRKRGYALYEACVEAARSRLRPILMSTLTTVISLIPMAFFPGETGAMTQPIGLTVLGGLTFGSMMTLFVMPIIYYIFNSRGEKKRVAEEEKLLQEGANNE